MTTHYVLYETETGRILQSGFSQDPNALAKSGQSILLDAVGTPQLDRVVDGEIIHLPEKPSENHQFNYATSQWELDLQTSIGNAQMKRQRLLSQSDWTDTSSAPARLGKNLHEAWQVYRQALRDVTLQSGFPFEIVWPTKPFV